MCVCVCVCACVCMRACVCINTCACNTLEVYVQAVSAAHSECQGVAALIAERLKDHTGNNVTKVVTPTTAKDSLLSGKACSCGF